MVPAGIFGPATAVVAEQFPLPTSGGLGGTSIKVRVGSTTLDCIMISSSATEVTAVLPSGTPTGEGRLTLTFGGQTSAPFLIQVVTSSFGIFAVNQRGTGPASVQNVNSETDQPLNGITKAAHPG